MTRAELAETNPSTYRAKFSTHIPMRLQEKRLRSYFYLASVSASAAGMVCEAVTGPGYSNFTLLVSEPAFAICFAQLILRKILRSTSAI